MIRVGDRVEWTWQCSRLGAHEDGCECAGVGTGVVVEVNTDPEEDQIYAVKIDGGEYMSVFDDNVLQVIR